ncbi:M28 family peptidase [Thalassotalea psychrophila]|uniref:M28 family peptidase n=1 Tax=Thalassotalea psychrophila TaxID=3065647 RepID=A0ABY9TQ95_9GAMM|nr:M28 family peptidase [Colwelliaceae bacterium SQ149]
MNIKTYCSTLLLGAFSCLCVASDISVASIEKDMQFLASDDLQGRLAGSPEIIIAEDYIATQFKQAGLQPLNGLTSFKQKFTLHRYIPNNITATLNSIKIASQNIAFAGSASSFEFTKDNTNISVVNDTDDLRSILSQANTNGGNIILLVNSAHAELFKRYKNHFSGGSQSIEERTSTALVMILTDTTNIDDLLISGSIQHQQQELTNIIAVKPGSIKPEEYVVFSAHHDHIGTHAHTSESANGKEDNIYNGANDDASGVSAVLNLARHYQNIENKRSIMYVTFTAEESGLLGSRYFIQDIDASSIVAMLNIEMIGKPSEFGPGTFWMTGFERSNLAQILNKNLNSIKQQVFADPYPKYKLFYRSDNASLAQLGVPAHSLSSTQMSNDHDYHQVSDELATLDLKQMTQIVNAIAAASVSLISGVDTPTRIEKVQPRTTGLIF